MNGSFLSHLYLFNFLLFANTALSGGVNSYRTGYAFYQNLHNQYEAHEWNIEYCYNMPKWVWQCFHFTFYFSISWQPKCSFGLKIRQELFNRNIRPVYMRKCSNFIDFPAFRFVTAHVYRSNEAKRNHLNPQSVEFDCIFGLTIWTFTVLCFVCWQKIVQFHHIGLADCKCIYIVGHVLNTANCKTQISMPEKCV